MKHSMKRIREKIEENDMWVDGEFVSETYMRETLKLKEPPGFGHCPLTQTCFPCSFEHRGRASRPSLQRATRRRDGRGHLAPSIKYAIYDIGYITGSIRSI